MALVTIGMISVSFLVNAFQFLDITLFLGRLLVAIGYACMFVYIPESFPTKLRGCATGWAMLFEAFGILTAPNVSILVQKAFGLFGVGVVIISLCFSTSLFLLLTGRERGSKELLD